MIRRVIFVFTILAAVEMAAIGVLSYWAPARDAVFRARYVCVSADSLTNTWEARVNFRASQFDIMGEQGAIGFRWIHYLEPTEHCEFTDMSLGVPYTQMEFAWCAMCPGVNVSWGFSPCDIGSEFVQPYRKTLYLTMPGHYMFLPLALLQIPIAIVLFTRFRGGRRRKLGLCVKCGYDLRATPERCPECGRAVERRCEPVGPKVE